MIALKSQFCQVCGQPAHGNHLGAVTCRACAVFFKRAVETKRARKGCKLKGNCVIFDGVGYPCKACRLARCRQLGMKQRDSVHLVVSTTIEQFVGRPSLVMFIDNGSPKSRSFIDVGHLILKGSEILRSGSPSPLVASSLEKMTMAIDHPIDDLSKIVKIDYFSRENVFKLWESDFLLTAKWLTHFDEFAKLPNAIQVKLLVSTWHLWSRIHRIVRTALHCKANGVAGCREVFIWKDCYVDLDDVRIDISWMTSYSQEQLIYFLDTDDRPIMEKVLKLDLSRMELTFLFGHLCFEYAKTRFEGKIAEVCEKFQDVLANDLHNYYITNSTDYKKQCNYAGRLAQMLKVNQEILSSIRQMRQKTHIARIFDIFTVDFSHPEMFIDAGCC